MKHSVLDLWGSVRPQEKKSSEKKLIDEIDPSWDISLWYIIKSWHVLKVMPIRASLSKWVDQSLPFWIPVCWVDYLSCFQRKLAEVSQFIKVITAFTVLFLLGTWGCRPPILYLSAHWEREALHLSNLRKPALFFDSSSLLLWNFHCTTTGALKSKILSFSLPILSGLKPGLSPSPYFSPDFSYRYATVN